MDFVCRKCGCEIDGKSPICMNCGAAIPDYQINPATKEKMKTENNAYIESGTSKIKALGAILLIIGISTDVISMFMIFSSEFEVFNAITIFGTICFLIGLALFGAFEMA